MRKIRTVTATIVLALLMSLGLPQAFAGEILTPPIAGDMQTPGLKGDMGTPPALNGEMSTPPALNGEMGAPGLYGDMATGLYAAIISFFG